MARTMTGAEMVLEALTDQGVEFVFGIPGTHSLELYRGLSTSSIRHVLPRHEQGGGFMADGYARVSGKPGVCFVITGAGVPGIRSSVAVIRPPLTDPTYIDTSRINALSADML